MGHYHNKAHWRSGVKPRVITWPHWKGSNLKTLKTKASWWKYHKIVWLWELIVKKQMIIEAKNLIRDNHNLLWKQVITFYPDGKWLWVSLRLLLQAIILWWDASALNSSKKKKKKVEIRNNVNSTSIKKFHALLSSVLWPFSCWLMVFKCSLVASSGVFNIYWACIRTSCCCRNLSI